MPGKFGVCTACQKDNHKACANEQVCICAMRGHPTIQATRQ